ncbi:MAG: ATP-binding protein [Solirubrobacterales bacterium]
MTRDSEIGRVVAVDTTQITVELIDDLAGMTRATAEGAQEVGRINSYVTVPAGARLLVGIVTRVNLTEDAELSAGKTVVSLPRVRRLLWATLIGTIDEDSFTQGVAVFPALDSPVHLATAANLNVIFDTDIETRAGGAEPGFCIELGEAALFPGHKIRLDPDAFFGKHAAVLGSTGSGKSSTIASLIQAILADPKVKRTTIVILDTNGEYSAALPGNTRHPVLSVPSDPARPEERLVVPYWFLGAEDFVRLFDASRGVQRPVLLEALRLARGQATSRGRLELLRLGLIQEFSQLMAIAGQQGKVSKDLMRLSGGLANWLESEDLNEPWTELEDLVDGIDRAEMVAAVRAVEQVGSEYTDQGKFPSPIPADARARIDGLLREPYETLSSLVFGEDEIEPGAHLSADLPVFFEKQRFRNQSLEKALGRQEAGGARAREYSGTMLLRIDQILADRRFDFMFGPEGEQWPTAADDLATFLRDTLGLRSATEHADEDELPLGSLPFYDRQRRGSDGHSVVILDLSLLASEVLENVTALVGRLTLEFLQRIGESSPEARGSLPVVLVLEEAQNYAAEPRYAEEESVSRSVFERIAREGRKYGLGLVVSSQRPSELSKTLLSQCNSFIVHRLQNPADLSYFRQIVPALFGPMLDQLPALPQRTALALGEFVKAPALVRIREARPTPRSHDPRFFASWSRDSPPEVDVEAIAAQWQGEQNSNQESQEAKREESTADDTAAIGTEEDEIVSDEPTPPGEAAKDPPTPGDGDIPF